MDISKFEIEKVIKSLKNLGNEAGWIEVKKDTIEADKLGETISSMANYCLLDEREFAYIIIGIEDSSWKVVGTENRFSNFRVKSQDIKLYLKTLLSPEIKFEFFDQFDFEDKKINIVKIESATHSPISFKGEPYIRMGSHNKKLKDFLDTTKTIWLKASGFNYEEGKVKLNKNETEILELLNFESFYALLKKEIPEDKKLIIKEFLLRGYIEKAEENERYNVIILGALLLARDLREFKLERKSVRVIKYQGKTKSVIESQVREYEGYGVGFVKLMKYVISLLPKEERFVDGIRETYSFYNEVVVRELVANAIIHQDFNISGVEVKIEIYEDRLEITNPGKSIIEILRFYDSNRSRNPKLALNMTEFGICEELGSGIDRIVEISEVENRFTPKYITTDDYVNVKLFKDKIFDNMSEEDKINIMFYHCCYRYSIEEYMSNSSLRNRFRLGNDVSGSSKISRLLKKAKVEGIVKDGMNKSYIPFWGE